MQNEIEENTTVAPWTDERFLRSRIVLGSEGLERLWGAHVVVVGYGAVGSAAAEALVRSGLGHIRIIDADVYDVTNTNRQLGCECSTIGKPKVEVAKARVNDIFTDTMVTTYPYFINEDNIEENDEYKELSQHLIRNKKEVKALKRIEKILKEVSE